MSALPVLELLTVLKLLELTNVDRLLLLLGNPFDLQRDRLSIKLDPDKTVANQSHLRRGTVRFDDWELSAKLVTSLDTLIRFFSGRA